MSLLKLMSEAEVTGKVKAVFDDIKATKNIDFVPNVWRALRGRASAESLR